MDFSRALGAEFRVVEERSHEGQPARAVVASRTYDTDAQDLWDALTSAERIPRWFAPISGDLKLGGRYQIEGNAGGVITRCDAPEAFDLTWEFGPSISWVAVRLAPRDGGTLLTLEHTMLKNEASEAHWKEYGPGATGVGWDLGFLGLDWYFANGQVALDRPRVDAWMASDAGKAFMRGCAVGWAEAHAKSGEAADVAQAMGDRTAAFYSGE